jgi:hypothetical protein
MTSARIVAVSCVFTTDFALGVWCKPDWPKSMVPRARTSTLFSQRSNKCAYRSPAIANSPGISDLIPRFMTARLNSLLLQNIRNLHPSVSVEVSVQEIRQIQQALPGSPIACEQISFNCRDFDFRFQLCPPIFTFLRVSFSRTRFSVTKT